MVFENSAELLVALRTMNERWPRRTPRWGLDGKMVRVRARAGRSTLRTGELELGAVSAGAEPADLPAAAFFATACPPSCPPSAAEQAWPRPPASRASALAGGTASAGAAAAAACAAVQPLHRLQAGTLAVGSDAAETVEELAGNASAGSGKGRGCERSRGAGAGAADGTDELLLATPVPAVARDAAVAAVVAAAAAPAAAVARLAAGRRAACCCRTAA